MTPAELRLLRDLMRAATPGPWRVEARGHASQQVARVNNLEVAPPDSVELAHCATDAAYIAAVSPDVVLGLIDEVLTSRRRIGALTTITDAQTARLQSYMNDGAKRAEAINTLASEREANALLTDEIERLRAELAETAPLTRFGAACLIAHREDLADLDAFWLEYSAERAGCLGYVESAEPCGEDCRCAEYGDDFPTQCLRTPVNLWRLAVRIDAAMKEGN